MLGAFAVGSGVVGRWLGRGQRHVEETRRLLRLDGVSKPRVPAEARIGLDGVSSWQTPADDFYLIHTAIAIPTVDPDDWRLRIHGEVENEIVLTYRDLMNRQLTEAWITLNCVSNPVGGTLVGNAWWSGVRLADLLALAGVRSRVPTACCRPPTTAGPAAPRWPPSPTPAATPCSRSP